MLLHHLRVSEIVHRSVHASRRANLTQSLGTEIRSLFSPTHLQFSNAFVRTKQLIPWTARNANKRVVAGHPENQKPGDSGVSTRVVQTIKLVLTNLGTSVVSSSTMRISLYSAALPVPYTGAKSCA